MVSYCSFNRLNTSTLCRSYFPPVNNIYFTGILKHDSCFLLHRDSWEYCINICIYSIYALSFWFTLQAQCFEGENTEWENTYLDLFPLEHRRNAGVKGGTREHGGNRVGEVQDLLKVRSHVLQKEVTRSNIELCGSSNFILSAVIFNFTPWYISTDDCSCVQLILHLKSYLNNITQHDSLEHRVTVCHMFHCSTNGTKLSRTHCIQLVYVSWHLQVRVEYSNPVVVHPEYTFF